MILKREKLSGINSIFLGLVLINIYQKNGKYLLVKIHKWFKSKELDFEWKFRSDFWKYWWIFVHHSKSYYQLSGQKYFINSDPFLELKSGLQMVLRQEPEFFRYFSGKNSSSPQQIFENDGKLYALATGNPSGVQIWELNSDQKLEKEEPKL